MENNLKNRYIYAVTRHLPAKIAKDVEQELDSLITEMVDERGGNPRPIGSQYPQPEATATTTNEQILKDVLAELGPPEELALKYNGSERKALISGVYYLMYKRLLRIVLPITAAVLAVLTLAGFLISDEATLHIVMGIVNLSFAAHAIQIIVVTLGGVLQTFAVITVIFAVMDYMKVDLKDGDFYDLPEVPETKMAISPYGPIVDIILSVSLTALLLGFPQVMRLYLDFTWMPVFDTAVIRGLWLPILLWSVLEIGIEIFKLIEGRYTMRLAMVAIFGCIMQAIFAISIFGRNNILNPDMIEFVENLIYASNYNLMQSFYRVIMRPNMMIMGIVLVALVVETIDIVVTAFKSSR